MKKSTSVILYFLTIIGIFALGIWLSDSVNPPEKTAEFLKEKGYTSIEVGSYNMWCAKGVSMRRYFTAIDPKGNKVSGKVCGKSLFYSESIDIASKK